MERSIKRPLKLVALLVSLAMLFCLGIYFFMGKESAMQFLGGYLIEFSLSMDNLFVFIAIFTAFAIPVEYQHRCLTWGIIGAIILRFIFIILGVEIVESFEWILYIFGALLIFNGIKMYKEPAECPDPQNSRTIRILSKIMPVCNDFNGNRFTKKIDGKLHATPLLAVLFMIELSDVLFAIDSVPAIFSITTDKFIIYTSNIFAILGLRQLYFVLAHMQERFQYVRYGVATILTFTGVKLGLLIWHIHIPIGLSIGIIFSVLLLSVVLSLVLTRKRLPLMKRKKSEIDSCETDI